MTRLAVSLTAALSSALSCVPLEDYNEQVDKYNRRVAGIEREYTENILKLKDAMWSRLYGEEVAAYKNKPQSEDKY